MVSASETSIQSVEVLLDEKPSADGETPWRALEYFASTRVIVAAALVFASAAFGARPLGVSGLAGSTLAASLSYFALAALFAGLSLYVHRRFLAQVIGQLVLDLIVITVLVVSSGSRNRMTQPDATPPLLTTRTVMTIKSSTSWPITCARKRRCT